MVGLQPRRGQHRELHTASGWRGVFVCRGVFLHCIPYKHAKMKGIILREIVKKVVTKQKKKWKWMDVESWPDFHIHKLSCSPTILLIICGFFSLWSRGEVECQRCKEVGCNQELKGR